MAEPLDAAALRDQLRARIHYLRDLGIFDLYRRESGPEAIFNLLFTSAPELISSPPAAVTLPVAEAGTPGHAVERYRPHPPVALEDVASNIEEDPAIAQRKAALPPIDFTPGPLIAPALRAEGLEALRREIGDCTRCPLGFAGRQTIVFGDGDPNARLLFVGEGPGADEDMQGVPFVGRAGQLLNNMITAMELAREQVYIANIVKCRPPKNRVPEPVEAITCSQFLLRQIDIVRPEVIVALGSTAATYLLGVKTPLGELRGRVHAAHNAKLIVTYHPAYLLRDPNQKKAAWTDLKLAMTQLTSTT